MCYHNPRSSQMITENIKTLKKPYIPGSSLKGAIKTAILYNEINVKKIPNIIDSVISKKGKRIFLNKKEYGKFLNKIFSNKKNPQSNIMRFLHVSDSSTVNYPCIYDVFTVMASNRGIEPNQIKKNAKSFLETINPKSKLKFKVSNNFDSKKYSSLNINDKEHLIELDNIKTAAYEFSKAFINHEIEFSEEYEINYLLKFYKKLEKRNKQSKPLLKVGGGSGFLATTIGLKVLEYDKLNYSNYMEEVRKLIKRTYPGLFPKSRKITETGKYPLGWIQLCFNEKGS